MTETEKENLSSFISSYQRTCKDIALCEIREMEALLTSYKKKEESLQEVMCREAPNYNIFEVLKIRHYEAKVHTPFLANLLNPKGSHQQGNLFLQYFFKEVIKSQEDPDLFTKVSVHSEKRNDQGQIDLEIWHNYNGVPKAMVIENKIFACDKPQQLFRCYLYLKSCSLPDADLKIIYLTLHGKSAEQQSTGLTPISCIQNISYNSDIRNWLNICMKLLPDNSIHHIIKQYLKTLSHLC